MYYYQSLISLEINLTSTDFSQQSFSVPQPVKSLLLCQTVAHTQGFYSNCMLLDSCSGHTCGPYGKQENVSLKFNYLCRAFITFSCFIRVMCCEPQGATVLFVNSPTSAPLSLCQNSEMVPFATALFFFFSSRKL